MSAIETSIDELLLSFDKCDIFTPDNISKIMSSYLLNEGNLLEPSVGEGNLLKHVNRTKYEEIDIYDIKKEYLDRCPTDDNINKFHSDFIKSSIAKKYKNIILNPPFVKIQDLSCDYRKYIKTKWEILKTGNIDLYYVFLVKCLDLLEDDGIMIAITPNSYLFNKSATKLRKMLIENRLIHEIIDYKSEKVFEDVSVYTCISIFSKKKKESLLLDGITINYSHINNKYYLFNNDKCSITTLNDICTIKNGIATLRDKIYIHDIKLFDEPCWQVITNSKKERFIIFPYDEEGKILDEHIFKNSNPKTYEYLEENKEELKKRDNGNKQYPKWYSFGRTQALIKSKNENVVFISTFINPKNINIQTSKPKLHYSSLCIESKNNYDLNKIIQYIKDNITFIVNNSSKRGGGWITLSGRVLKQIPIK